MNKRPWEDKWERGEPLEHGSQAHTFLAKPKGTPEDKCPFVLKILRRQNDMERRGRMHREVSSLRTVKHSGVAKYEDSNSDQFEDLNVELYLVTEFTEGLDLKKLVQSGSVELERAVQIVLSILDVLEFCHTKDVIHRDIKPCHIILRDNHDDEPVLLDFGLSFNNEITQEAFQTEEGQQLGNRFLNLPELTNYGPKRDRRSDITQCVGLLFYMLTGLPPVNLIDQHGKKPNQREDAKKLTEALDSKVAEKLTRIFDVGFNQSISERWQSVSELKRELSKLVSQDSAVEEVDWLQELVQLKEGLLSPRVRQLSQFDALINKLNNIIMNTLSECMEPLNSIIRWKGPGMQRNAEKHVLTWKSAYTHQYDPNKRVDIETIVKLDEAELVFLGTSGGTQEEIMRMGLFVPLDENAIKSAVGSFTVRSLKQFLS